MRGLSLKAGFEGQALEKVCAQQCIAALFPQKRFKTIFWGHPVDLSLLLRSLAEIYLARATVA